MIITFSGDEGSGKSTVAKKIAATINYPRYYMGQIFRDIAKKKGLTLVEYVKLGETDPNVDKEVDDYLLALAKKEKDSIIEGRVAWHLIPESLKIYFKVDENEGARRIFLELNKENQRNEIQGEATLEKIITKARDRRATDDKRYKKYYGINIRDAKNYDFVLDTTDLSIEEVFEETLKFIKTKLEK
jgi:cytidylate kinase